MFSKNFYEIDEVVAMLIATFFRQAPIETLFWAKELIDSFATSYLIEALVIVYTLKFGSSRLEYINVLSEIVLRKKWYEYDLMRVTYLLTLIDSKYISHSVLDYLTDLHLNNLEPLKDIKEVSQEWLGRKSKAFDIAMHYIMKVVEPNEESLVAMELPHLPSLALRLIFKEKGRARRFFSVHNRDLYGMCQRGFMSCKENTNEKLLTAHKTYYTSNCWIGSLGPEIAYSEKNEEIEAWEKTIQQIFPDNIPDEWSQKEREKSHGCGVLKENEKVCVRKWLERHLGIINDKYNFQINPKIYIPYSLFIYENNE
jgi:hypothetical protein